MPGFRNANHTGRHASFRDGMNIVKKANSKNARVSSNISRITKSESGSKSRQKANSEAMYASSASVPDSLIAFTNEIHLVRLFLSLVLLVYAVVLVLYYYIIFLLTLYLCLFSSYHRRKELHPKKS